MCWRCEQPASLKLYPAAIDCKGPAQVDAGVSGRRLDGDGLPMMMHQVMFSWRMLQHEARDIRTEEAPIPAEAFDQGTCPCCVACRDSCTLKTPPPTWSSVRSSTPSPGQLWSASMLGTLRYVLVGRMSFLWFSRFNRVAIGPWRSVLRHARIKIMFGRIIWYFYDFLIYHFFCSKSPKLLMEIWRT